MVTDPKVDELIAQATAATGEERAKLWKEIFQRVNEEIISDIPMFHMVGFTRVAERLDFKPTIATNSELQLRRSPSSRVDRLDRRAALRRPAPEASRAALRARRVAERRSACKSFIRQTRALQPRLAGRPHRRWCSSSRG